VTARVAAVSRSASHTFHKQTVEAITLVAGLGVDGDAHAGVTVRHRSRVRRDPGQPNLRQVHLVASELHADLRRRGFVVGPGLMGENITTTGLDLLDLPIGTLLRFQGHDAQAVLAVTGLRNPCVQLDRWQRGLQAAVLEREADGQLARKAGVMAVVVEGGVVRPGDEIRVELPPLPHRRLLPV